MILSSIRFYNFRNLADDEVSVCHDDVFLVGENGQGKTNFLETVYYLSYGSSFRLALDKPIIRSGFKDCVVEGKYQDGILDSHEVKVTIENGQKSIELNGKKLRDRKELIYKAPCILFSHDDMDFVCGSMDRRRQFYDQTLTLCDPDYIDCLRRYKKILSLRNAVLKTHKTDVLDAYDQQLAAAGIDLALKRYMLSEEFGTLFSSLFEEVSATKHTLRIDYRPSWTEFSFDFAIKSLEEKRNHDLDIGATSTGPHRDSFAYFLDDRAFSQFASTGQIRLASLVLRIGQASFVSKKIDKKTIMLFDDVLLELDPAKRKRFLKAIPPYEQGFYTFLPGEPYEDYIRGDTLVYNVSGGHLVG